MKHFSLILGLFALTMFDTANAQTVFIVQTNILPPNHWQNTGVSLAAGDKIVIIGEGVWKIGGSDSDPLQWMTADGVSRAGGGASDHAAPGANDYSLVGKIGTSGTPFGVGSFCKFTAASAGTLYLTVNDWVTSTGYSDNYGYLIAIIFKNSLTSINSGSDNSLPQKFELGQNYPNPFNPETKFEYTLKERGNIKVQVFDELGKLVTTIVQEMKGAGKYEAMWNGKNSNGESVSSGSYYYQLVVNDVVQTKKMIMIK